MVATKLDPVALRLAEVEDQSVSLLHWLDSQKIQKTMRSRANWCAIRAWGLMTAAAIVGSIVALTLSSSVHEIIGAELPSLYSSLWYLPAENAVDAKHLHRMSWIPGLMGMAAITLVVGGLAGWITGHIPGLRRTLSAIEWASVSDAIARLLAVDCTYPEAFRTVSKIAETSEAKRWLVEAAQRVERGQGAVVVSRERQGDLASLELMVEAGSAEPQKQWRIVSDHFFHLANHRSVNYQHVMPVLAAIIAGLFIWISISSSLSLVWRSMGEMITSLT